jgi:hypothetical protein
MSFLAAFLPSLRFFVTLVGMLFLGETLALITEGAAIDRVIFSAAIGCIGLVLYDPRGRWYDCLALVVGAFGLAGLNMILRPIVRHQSSWTHINLLKAALYTVCFAEFFVWSARNKRSLANPAREGPGDRDRDAAT